MVQKKKRNVVHKCIFVALLILVLILGGLNLAKAKGLLLIFPEAPLIENKTVSLNSLTLEQKIAQMTIVHGAQWNMGPWKKLQIGGIHLFALKAPELYQGIISEYQKNVSIPFLVTADLEGCWNPFSYFKNFTAISEVNSREEAYSLGKEEGRFLKNLGFTVDFSPVVDLKDEIWKCRSFPGDEKQISKLAQAYIEGMQSEGILATAKHYPGKTLVIKDPHKYLVSAEISTQDIYPFYQLANTSELRGVMVSHVISGGAVNSEGKPAVVSEVVLSNLKSNFSGLVFSDEVNMLGLKDYYSSLNEMYLAVYGAGNDLVINFNDDPNEIYHMIQVVKKGVEEGKISEEQIDLSVRKILEAKGFTVVE
jgi:beta-glucosidase-like glycosyl hydrolase